MRLSKFVEKYAGTKVDYDNSYGPQCVDLFRAYCSEVLNIPHTGAVNGAKDLWLKYDVLELEKKYFYNCKSEELGLYGDVAIWGASGSNPFGHVAIVLEDRKNILKCFSQDGLSDNPFADIIFLRKDNLLGYLRPNIIELVL